MTDQIGSDISREEVSYGDASKKVIISWCISTHLVVVNNPSHADDNFAPVILTSFINIRSELQPCRILWETLYFNFFCKNGAELIQED